MIEILVLQALAHQAQGDIPAALAPLQQALTLAEPEGYIRIFLDEGSCHGATASRSCRAEGSSQSYTGKLLAAFASGCNTGRLAGLKSSLSPVPVANQPTASDRAAQPA